MKKAAITLGVLLGVYCSLFFLWAPINMMGVKYQQPWLMNLSYRYDALANSSWVGRLNRDNIIFKARYNNTIFWCNHFERCTTDESS